MAEHQSLQVTFLRGGQAAGYRLFRRPTVVTIGSAKRVTFITPQLPGFRRRFRLLTPVRDGVRLHLGPGMKGSLTLRGQERQVGDLLAQPAQRRFLRDQGMFRHTELYPGDSARIDLDDAGTLRLHISFCEAPEKVPRPGLVTEPLFVRAFAGTALALGLLVTFLWLWGEHFGGEELAVSQDRLTRITPVLDSPKMKAATEKRKEDAAEKARRRQEKEAAETRRAAREQGRIGHEEATAKDTVIPKGREDRLREKVAKTGLLAALGNSRPSGSGLARLFDRDDSGEMEQAMNGLAGAQLVAGKGKGGLGDLGTGLGGGGTGVGKIQGSGSLDFGSGRGRGRKGPNLGRGREKEVKVGMETGTADASGGLSKDQIHRVVRAHAAAIRYCFEKELQRQPSLAGKIELYWLIKPSGAVDRIKIASSTMGSKAVEGCMERQVRNWQFPRSDSDTIVQSYPFFFFKGGGA
jgi:hypothetical protein